MIRHRPRPTAREREAQQSIYTPLDAQRWCERCHAWRGSSVCGWCGATTDREPPHGE
jgi:hypothetical protein